MVPVEFWYDFASPYCYLAAMGIEERAAAAGVAVTWRPFLLGPILKARPGNPVPTQNASPAERRYRRRDVTRLCARFGLALVWPSNYPRGSLVATIADAAAWAPAFARAVFHANFADDRDIADTGVVAAILDGLGLPAADLLDQAEQPAAKTALKAAGDRAVALGIFGAPTFRAADELFWGHDRLDQALDWAARPETRIP
ncbi:MAG: 2-hydroxychromene-2-carboxylate isomerase [Alphaproteobacteria bacterium]|nr:2-hydroxychromene-2-carboxylate isomerase [Alphaproteobacteria bacterium]